MHFRLSDRLTPYQTDSLERVRLRRNGLSRTEPRRSRKSRDAGSRPFGLPSHRASKTLGRSLDYSRRRARWQRQLFRSITSRQVVRDYLSADEMPSCDTLRAYVGGARLESFSGCAKRAVMAPCLSPWPCSNCTVAPRGASPVSNRPRSYLPHRNGVSMTRLHVL